MSKVSNIKKDLLLLIEQEDDERILEAVRVLLQPKDEEVLKEKLAQRAMKAEMDIEKGRVLSAEQMRAATQTLLSKCK